MSSLYTPSSLAGLFVFNPTLGDEATEGLKILTFHPKIDIDRQKTYVGLTEGLVAFTRYRLHACALFHCHFPVLTLCARAFFFLPAVVSPGSDYSPEKPLEAMHTEKHRYAFFECEKDYWMVLVVENPRVAKDAKSAPVYAEDELDDSILQSLLKHAYSLFSVRFVFRLSSGCRQ